MLQSLCSSMAKILLVEDDQVLSEMYQEALTSQHFDVRPVSDGAEALAAAHSYMPDLILLDLLLPGIDGASLLPMFKMDEALKAIPIIILSNISSAEKIKELMSKGASDYMLKVDVTPDQIVSRICKILNLPLPPDPNAP